MTDLIIKKRNGQRLSKEELQQIVHGFVSGDIPDYQIAAFLMAVYFKGMAPEETAIFTELMMHSGEVIDLSSIEGIKVDKHSTGGVGDKTTLILAPLVAAAGVPVAKMTGRGLGHTGGTIDKLESIKGLSVEMTQDSFKERVVRNGIAICGQNANLVPADKKLYALRDVTGTVKEYSLIASSIMSKKLACGADAIVIDIKLGDGAYMKTMEEAMHLGKSMKSIGEQMGRKVVCVITAMDQPLGRAVGNAIEVREAIDTLLGNGPEDLTLLCYELGAQMLLLAGAAQSKSEAVATLKSLIHSGKAFEKFKTMISEQGGDIGMIDEPNLLPSSRLKIDFTSPVNGFVTKVKAFDIGIASMKLGAGRETKESQIDPGVGVYLHKKMGESVIKGEAVASLYANDESQVKEAMEWLKKAYNFGDDRPELTPLILEIIE